MVADKKKLEYINDAEIDDGNNVMEEETIITIDDSIPVDENISKKYKVIAIKPTFVVVKNENDIRSIEHNIAIYKIGDIVEI